MKAVRRYRCRLQPELFLFLSVTPLSLDSLRLSVSLSLCVCMCCLSTIHTHTATHYCSESSCLCKKTSKITVKNQQARKKQQQAGFSHALSPSSITTLVLASKFGECAIFFSFLSAFSAFDRRRRLCVVIIRFLNLFPVVPATIIRLLIDWYQGRVRVSASSTIMMYHMVIYSLLLATILILNPVTQ